jgi:hypothetical protein
VGDVSDTLADEARALALDTLSGVRQWLVTNHPELLAAA